MEVCATLPHFPPDATEVLLGPGAAPFPRTQKDADGGQNPLQSAAQSEWTKQGGNAILSEREQHLHQLE